MTGYMLRPTPNPDRFGRDGIAEHAPQRYKYLSPGYLGRMRERAHKDWGQEFWWKPGTGLPDRAPRLVEAVGG